VRIEPRGSEARPITDVTSIALGKEETAVRLQVIRDEESEGESNAARRPVAR
jgi:hypothetical protein